MGTEANKTGSKARAAALASMVGALLVTSSSVPGTAATSLPPGEPAPFKFNPPPSFVPAGFTTTHMRSWSERIPSQPTITILEEREETAAPPATDRELIRQIDSGIWIIHRITGVTDWKLTQIDRLPLPNGTLVVLLGNYRDSQKALIRFEQWKYYTRHGFSQIEYSEAAGKGARSYPQIAELLTRYQPCGT